MFHPLRPLLMPRISGLADLKFWLTPWEGTPLAYTPPQDGGQESDDESTFPPHRKILLVNMTFEEG